jgi:hypothetical protein
MMICATDPFFYLYLQALVQPRNSARKSGIQHTLKKQGKTPWGKFPASIPAIILDISGRDATARGHLRRRK